MALVFYGMPLLCENNKPRLLYYLKRRGYRGFSINRPDKLKHKLSVTEKEIGGIPNSSEDIKQAHAAALESYIENHVGLREVGYGNMYFQRTLEDWAMFNKNRYRPIPQHKANVIKAGIKTYDNTGTISKIIQ